MAAASVPAPIRVGLVGLGNCAGSLIEGLAAYRQAPASDGGLLFPLLCGYSVRAIDIVAAFDIAAAKVGKPISEAIYQAPNNFVRIPTVRVEHPTLVARGPTLDGNPEHLARFVGESSAPVADVVAVLRDQRTQILVNFLPTGSLEASEFYAQAALEAGCAFINCTPTVLAQRPALQASYQAKQLPLLGDDIKSQLGTTILHRALLQVLEMRGATLQKTSQVNIGGNTDFANFVHRAETKLISKRKSLARYVGSTTAAHVGHHYDPTKGPWKHAYIEIEARVFGDSPVKLVLKLESDDKPNSAGSVADLIRLAKGALERQQGGCIPEACAFYCKSPPTELDELQALALIRQHWLT